MSPVTRCLWLASNEPSCKRLRDLGPKETSYMPDFVFGYGSLVNTKTHGYRDVKPAEIKGWRRRWCQREDRPWAFLAVRPFENALLRGVVARVAEDDWADLDRREASYVRTEVQCGPQDSVALYWVADGTYPPVARPRPILLSYLDVCVEGYQAAFGPDGHQPFFETTDGWEFPIVDDRCAPIYPRTTRPGLSVQASTDQALAGLGIAPLALSAVMKELE